MGGRKKDVDDIVEEYVRRGWTVTIGGRYRKMKCPCGEHMKTVHWTPSNRNYARNLRAWFRRTACPGEEEQ